MRVSVNTGQTRQLKRWLLYQEEAEVEATTEVLGAEASQEAKQAEVVNKDLFTQRQTLGTKALGTLTYRPSMPASAIGTGARVHIHAWNQPHVHGGSSSPQKPTTNEKLTNLIM